MDLKYGDRTTTCTVDSRNLLGVLQPKPLRIKPIEAILKERSIAPIGKPRLRDLLARNKPRDIVIIVSDATRQIANYALILDFIVGEIVDAGIDEKCIEFMIALGTHRRHTEEENTRCYGKLLQHFPFQYHNCHDDCTCIGKTTTGLEVCVNRRAKEAEFVIATGKINLHYIAGFSGGRKSILPGIASYHTIRNNHCKLKREGVGFGVTEGNVIAREMEEAADLFRIDYLVNTVEDEANRTGAVLFGDPLLAFNEGVGMFLSQRSIEIAQQSDCAVVSAGGYPHDRTFFNGHKALNSVIKAVRPGGTLVLVSQCVEGLGNEDFVKYMTDHSIDELLSYPEDLIEIGGHRAFVTARILHEYEVCAVTGLDHGRLSDLHFIPVHDVERGLQRARAKFGNAFTTYVIPDGTSIVPVLKNKEDRNRRLSKAERRLSIF